MTTAAATAPAEPRTLSVRIPVDDLSKYAGITALVSAVLAVAGVVATAAYLSAWGVPGPVIRMDPMTAALRSETVIYQVVLLGLVLLGLTTTRRRLAGRRRTSAVVLGAIVAAIAGLTVMLVLARATGPATTLIGGVALFVAHQRRALGSRGLAVAFAAIAIYAAYETGFESGLLAREDPAWQTPAAMTVRVPAAGLEGGIEAGGGWHYDDLYLVFRDGESVYVSRDGAGARVWIVPTGNLMSLELGGR